MSKKRLSFVLAASGLLFAASPLSGQPSVRVRTAPSVGCVPSTSFAASAAPPAVKWRALVRTESALPFPTEGVEGVLGIRSFDIDPKGRLLIIDSRARRVSIRNSAGQVLHQLGREGSGPGEYRVPSYGAFVESGHVWLLDKGLSRLSIFDRAGKYLKSVSGVPVDARAVYPIRSGEGFISIGVHLSGKGAFTAEAHAIEGSGRALWQAVPVDREILELKQVVGDAWAARLDDGSLVLGLSAVPGVSRIDAGTGAILCSSELPKSSWKQLRASQRPKEGGLKAMTKWIQDATYAVAAAGLPRGGVLIETSQTMNNGSEKRMWTGLDAKLFARFVVVDAPGRLQSIRGDTVFYTQSRDDGSEVLVRSVARFPNMPR